MSTLEPYRIVLADDHAVFRSGIRALLEAEPDLQVVGEAVDGQHAIALAEQLRPHVLVLDIEMPGLSGPEVVEHLAKAGISVRVLALSAHKAAAHVERLARAGAAGFITKEKPPPTIVEAVRAVAQGEERWFVRPPTGPMLKGLSERELEVVKLLAQGASNADIADRLFLSEYTVRNHLVSVYQKLGVVGAREAIAWAWETGLVRPKGT